MQLIQFIEGYPGCIRFKGMLGPSVKLQVAETHQQFTELVAEDRADAGILCYCFADEQAVSDLIKLSAEVEHLPIIVCTKIPNPRFIRKAAQKGLDHFVFCTMSNADIRSEIQEAVEHNGLRMFIENLKRPETYTPYTRRIIAGLLHSMPSKPGIGEIADSLGISIRWTQTVIRESFGMTYTELIRKVLVYRALNLMKHSQLDNTEIALVLEYQDENSLSRIFRKELGYSPSDAREMLGSHSPEQLLSG